MPKILVFLVSCPQDRNLDEALVRLGLDPPPEGTELLVVEEAADGLPLDLSPEGSRPGAGPPRASLRIAADQGPGTRQKLGLRYAIDCGFDVVVSLRGDGRLTPDVWPRLVAPLLAGEADAVLGARRASVSAAEAGTGLARRIGERLLTRLQGALARQRLGDLHSGVRAYSVAALAALPFERNGNGDRFDSELVLQLLAAGRRLAEVPVPGAAGDGLGGLRAAGGHLAATLTARLQSWGLLYRRNFDVGGEAGRYAMKTGFPSSHSFAIEAVPEGARVLDVGCGAGELGALLEREKGCRVTGVEGEPERAAVAAARLSRLIRHDLDDRGCLDHELGEVDVVLLLDVVEHLRRPEDFLDELRRRIGRERPRVILTVPNVAFFVVRWSLLLGWFNYGPRGILDRTHTRLFTFASLRRLLEEAGFEAPRLRGIPAPFPLALGPTRIARWLLGINALLIRLLPTLFSYQIFAEARLPPLVSHLLEDSMVEAAAASSRAAGR